MEAKEKAKELVDTFKIPAYVWSGNGYDVNEKETLGNAKRCALIAVDEIEKALDNESGGWNSYYWQQVKTEIEKL